MSDKTCPVCARPQVDGIVCRSCCDKLRADLEALPELWRHLDLTITRQSATSDEKVRRGVDMPLPYDWSADHTRDDVVSTITTWVRELDLGDKDRPGTNMRSWCNWLVRRIPRIAMHPAADEIVDELRYMVTDVRRAIDQPAHMEFYGQCAVCTRDLYGATDADEVLCRYCDRAGIEARYPTAGRRAGLWQTAPDALVPRRVALAALPVWGMQVAPSTFHGWVREGKIEPRHDEDRPNALLYRLGDVLDLAANMETQEQTRQVIGWNLTRETMAG